jgi:hypothetical protein
VISVSGAVAAASMAGMSVCEKMTRRAESARPFHSAWLRFDGPSTSTNCVCNDLSKKNSVCI